MTREEFEKTFALPFCWGVSRKSLLKNEPDSMEKRIAGSLALAIKLSYQNVSLLRFMMWRKLLPH